MPFLSSKKPFHFFLTIILFFVLKINLYGQTINNSNFRIDTLKAFYTSGTASTKIIGSIYLSFKIPAGKTATLLMKINPTGNYTAIGSYGTVASTNIQKLNITVPNLFVRDEFYCFHLELTNGASTIVTKELCSIPIALEPNLTPDNRYVFQLGSYQPGTSNPNATFRPFITGKCLSLVQGCNDDIDDFATNTVLTAPHRARKEYNSFVKCGELKVFEAYIDIDGMITISDTIRNLGYTKQRPPKLIEEWAYATVENDKVKLVWKNDETINDTLTIEKKFIVERKDGPNGNYVTLPDSPELTRKLDEIKYSWEFTDQTSSPSKTQHFYRLKYEDLCQNISLPINLYPIHLQQDQSFALIWNGENNDKIIDYELEFFDITTADPRKIFLIQPKGNKFKAETSNFYRIKAKQFGGDKSYIYSNFIPNNENLSVLNPNVFTPDGKGPADSETFKVFCAAAYTFEMVIYDRNGLMVYYSDNYQAHRRDGWNGKLIYTDIDCKEDQYVFQVNVTNSNHRGFIKRGNVLLIRE